MNKRTLQLVKYELNIDSTGEDLEHLEEQRNMIYKHIGKKDIYQYLPLIGKQIHYPVCTAEYAMSEVIAERIMWYLRHTKDDEETITDKVQGLFIKFLGLNPKKERLESLCYIMESCGWEFPKSF